MVMCKEPEMLAPASGCAGPNSAMQDMRPGGRLARVRSPCDCARAKACVRESSSSVIAFTRAPLFFPSIFTSSSPSRRRSPNERSIPRRRPRGARAQRGRFPTHRPAFRIDRSRNRSSTARAPRDAASRVPLATRARSIARNSLKAHLRSTRSSHPRAIVHARIFRPHRDRRHGRAMSGSSAPSSPPSRANRTNRVERVGASRAPEISLRHVANLVFATGAGRLDDAHGGRHDGCG